MNPFLSMSSANDLVSGSEGDPAITTTSSLAPFLAFFARLVFLLDLVPCTVLYTTVPAITTTTPVRTLCLATQSWTCWRRDAAMAAAAGARTGGEGRMESGIHGFDERFSRTTCAAWSTF